MTDQSPDLNAGYLPRLTRTRPAADPTPAGRTVTDLFGCDGHFFTVPGTFPHDLPDHITHTDSLYAVLHTTDPATGSPRYTVHDVDCHRLPLGEPGTRKIDVVRNALAALAAHRRAHAAQVTHNRVHLRGLPPAPPIRIGYDDTHTCIVHVRCACPHIPGLSAHFEHFQDAAADWLTETSDPWQLCPTSPHRAVTTAGTGDVRATHRDDQGAPVIEVLHDGYSRPAVLPLTYVKDITDRN